MTLASTTVTHVRANEAVKILGGSLSASELTIRDVFPGHGLVLDYASVTIDKLSIDSAWSGGIHMYLSNATITDAVIHKSSTAVIVNGSSTLVIASSTISGNSSGFAVYGNGKVEGEGLVISGCLFGVSAGKDAIVEIHDSVIAGNSEGVYNPVTPSFGTNSVDVTNNYWGSPTGPTLPGQPAHTNGDSITANVDATPFLTSDPTIP